MESEAELLRRAQNLLDTMSMDMADFRHVMSCLPRGLAVPIESAARSIFLRGLTQP